VHVVARWRKPANQANDQQHDATQAVFEIVPTTSHLGQGHRGSLQCWRWWYAVQKRNVFCQRPVPLGGMRAKIDFAMSVDHVTDLLKNTITDPLPDFLETLY
jgi:hypothetical protein